MAEVRIEALTKRYGDSTAVDGLDLTVADGEFVTLLGPSGCGKTTTLRCIAGLEIPDGGEIAIGGKLASAPRQGVFTRPEKRDIGMVFQSYALWPHMTVAGNVGYPLKLARTPRAAIDKRVGEMLELVGLSHLASRRATSLSGGQQQRVAVARALVSRPRLLLFDEPLSNLDARLRASMRAELRAIHARTGTTSVCVTHDQVEALTLSDRVVVMNAGRVVQVGTPEQIFGAPADHFVAHFVGFDVFLPGELIGLDGKSALVRLEGTGQIVRSTAGDGLRLNQAVEVATRSSAVRIHPRGDNEPPDAVTGTVVDRAFMGDSVQFTLDVGGHQILALVPTDDAVEGAGRLDPGSTISMQLKLGSTRVFPLQDRAPTASTANPVEDPAPVVELT